MPQEQREPRQERIQRLIKRGRSRHGQGLVEQGVSNDIHVHLLRIANLVPAATTTSRGIMCVIQAMARIDAYQLAVNLDPFKRGGRGPVLSGAHALRSHIPPASRVTSSRPA